MNALANDQVGDFVNQHFVASYKKVGTFQKAGTAKQGGNVATYICLPDETVLHVIPGPVNADAFLREARWAVDVYESAVMESNGSRQALRNYIRTAHALRYETEHMRPGQFDRPGRSGRSADVSAKEVRSRQVRAMMAPQSAVELNDRMPRSQPNGVSLLGQGHWLMWSDPLPKLGTVYKTVWTQILREPLTDIPVVVR
ncbi:MAG TPA: hypothetical protein VKE40_17865 [Gemmataceae bacterium]|nr:hypothetical protein [Gemmataceae bacterium]